MINFSSINCPNEKREYNQQFKKLLNNTFRYTRIVNAHVIYNFKSPTNVLGEYEFILFIDIPYESKNYYRTQDHIYLNTLAIAVRNFEESEVIDVDDNWLYTVDGSWEYAAEIESDRKALRSYVYDNIPNVNHFDIAVMYVIKAINCNKRFRNDYLCFNMGVNLSQAINNAIVLTQSHNGKSTNCISYKDKTTPNNWSDFITCFIDVSERHTQQGILTKNKVDYITKKKLTRLMEQVNQAIGKKLCIINGKAGTGKTLALLQLMHEQIRNKHHCRLLTFNNMLVMDLKMIMKSIGVFTPTNASISSLHKFFYDIYKASPVRYLHMDSEKINLLFNLCMKRTLKFNCLIQVFSKEKSISDLNVLINELDMEMRKENSRIEKEEKDECIQYQKYLLGKNNLNLSNLNSYALEYVEYKRKTFLKNYYRREFLNGYNVILEELYLVFHNIDDFINKYNMKIAYSAEELRNTDEFKRKHQEVYNKFLNEALQQMQKEYGNFDELIPNFMQSMETLYAETVSEFTMKSKEEQKEFFIDSLKKIRGKINWSKLILVDEAQDCQVNEKALLFELNGSDNIVIATGGRDQLVRTAQENDWSQLFGIRLDAEKIKLNNVSYRQKGNIILFLNAFAEAFNIETRLRIPNETKNSGRVIIDCRKFGENMIPDDKIGSLHLNGKDMGCSNFENMMFLLPQSGYIKRMPSEDTDVLIDNNNTILISQASAKRTLSMNLPDNFKPIDGTVNDKRDALKNVGQDNTRCLLYESCRGLEAWNVMCMDLNDFYYEKLISRDAEEYADTYAGKLFEEDKEKYKAQYAALWCFMAITRAIDTLYIKLSNTNNCFSQSILEIAKKLHNIEILEGEYQKEIVYPSTLYIEDFEDR